MSKDGNAATTDLLTLAAGTISASSARDPEFGTEDGFPVGHAMSGLLFTVFG
ncbi:hypothetical protein AB7813_04605 [Tardiphaga sp. 20_F10_N6_6]|jgi:hypothetical protein|uniref:hypothetical protein n=1 Tax=unclassified Tardiphaga TaxID=2631404 RepID=UPI000FF49B8B